MENKQDKGFTLVELLIVIVILGILATVTVFAVRGITDKGQQNACKIERKTLDTAIESYYAQNQKDPLTQGTKAAPGDLVPAFLSTDIDTAKWTFVPPVAAVGATPAQPAKFTAVALGKCAGY